jgi:hypothetical protein
MKTLRNTCVFTLAFGILFAAIGVILLGIAEPPVPAANMLVGSAVEGQFHNYTATPCQVLRPHIQSATSYYDSDGFTTLEYFVLAIVRLRDSTDNATSFVGVAQRPLSSDSVAVTVSYRKDLGATFDSFEAALVAFERAYPALPSEWLACGIPSVGEILKANCTADCEQRPVAIDFNAAAARAAIEAEHAGLETMVVVGAVFFTIGTIVGIVSLTILLLKKH